MRQKLHLDTNRCYEFALKGIHVGSSEFGRLLLRQTLHSLVAPFIRSLILRFPRWSIYTNVHQCTQHDVILFQSLSLILFTALAP